MRIILTIFLAAFALVGCAGPGGSNSAANTAKSNSAPIAKKVVDMPALVGKSNEEIKTIIGETPKFETPYLAFDLPEGELTVDSMKGRQTSIGFKKNGAGVAEPAELGDLVGIDLHGIKIPTSSGEFYFYDDVKTSRGILKRVSLHKKADGFDQISIDFDSL